MPFPCFCIHNFIIMIFECVCLLVAEMVDNSVEAEYVCCTEFYHTTQSKEGRLQHATCCMKHY
jgi:hypothetical protein